MNAYKIVYENGTFEVVTAQTALEVIKKYDLATKKHINTRVIQLEGEQKAIAFSNLQEDIEDGEREEAIQRGIEEAFNLTN